MIVNLTPHTINFIKEGGEEIKIEPSGVIARLSTSTETVGMFDGIPVTETRYGEVENMPEPKKGTVYVVSSLVAGRLRDRIDVFVPNESIRDEAGRIVGCRSLGRV